MLQDYSLCTKKLKLKLKNYEYYYDYSPYIISQIQLGFRNYIYVGLTLMWDNLVRIKVKHYILHGSIPEKYKEWLTLLKKSTIGKNFLRNFYLLMLGMNGKKAIT